MEDEEKEDYITGYPIAIPFNSIEEMINQMKKNICKIKIGDEQGTGFFCKIPFPDQNNMLKVLITNNHVIKEDILFKKDQEISILIKEEKKIRKLNLNDRIKYTNDEKIYDITIIEIKEEDNINNFLELDDNVLNDIIKNENENVNYIDKTFYVIQYPEGELSASFGVILNIFEEKTYKFIHKCNTKLGSSGSPILALNNKIIGIHTGGKNSNKFGIFLNYPIKDFIKQNYNKMDDKNDKSIIDDKINEIFLEEINNKFKLDLKNVNIINYDGIKKYLGDDGFKELKELYLYYKNKMKAIEFVDLNFHKTVIEQMEKCICEIYTRINDYNIMRASGFFCRIPFPDKNNMIKVLITNNHVINEKALNQKYVRIEIMKHGYKEIIELWLDKKIKYTNKEYDITIIEINEEDEINNFLELDDKILNNIMDKNNEIKEFLDNEIYLPQYARGKLSVSFGMINHIYEDKNYNFAHNSSAYEGSSGSPILGLNNKVIGLHIIKNKYNKHNKGLFLNRAIEEFIESKYYNNIKFKKQLINESDKKNNLIIQDNQMKMWNLIKKNLDEKILTKLNDSYRNLKLNLNIYYSREIFFDFTNYKVILEQMENYVHIIKIGNKETIGFFCTIPLHKKNNNINVLITNNSTLNEEIMKEKNIKILIEFQKEKKIKEIMLTNRKYYTNKEYNTTIIEIKKEDKIDNYLELDKKFIVGDEINFRKYEHKNIYIINNKIGKLALTFCYLYGIYEDKKYNFIIPSVENLVYGAPIFGYNNKLIGLINKEVKNKFTGKKFSVGTFLYYPMKEFIDNNYN